MDTIEFTQKNILELTQRIFHINEVYDTRNFNKSKKEVTQQFLKDQDKSA